MCYDSAAALSWLNSFKTEASLAEMDPTSGLEETTDIPSALGEDLDEASISTELPVVVLGQAGESVTPRRRVLYGRVPERWVLYPIYLTVTIAGALAANFALKFNEWHPIPIALAWASLFVWYWFYGVAYRYRRRLLKYTSVAVIVGVSWALAFFCEDRAMRQIVAVDGQLLERASVVSLQWAAIVTRVGVVGLAAHVVFLGRGYREKRDGGHQGS